MGKHRILHKITAAERYLFITFGIALLAIGFYFFYIPHNFVTGGVGGLAIILNEYIPNGSTSFIVFLLNLALLFLGLIMLGKKVFIRSIYGSLMFPLFVFILENNLSAPMILIGDTSFIDYAIVSIFGGAVIGIGFGLVIRYGGTSGGSDIPIRILNDVFKLPLSISIYLIDGGILVFGILVFFKDYGISGSLYAVLAIIISGVVSDYVVLGAKDKRAVHIISKKQNEIKTEIYNMVSRGVTFVDATGGFTNENKTLIITVITKREYFTIRSIVSRIDPEAFIYVVPASEIQGDFLESD
jgi:uncharacterized membrane-anchored protein YitT (DUF2179 family)